ncbi:nucleotidyltransferase domain-containing protein [bacterium]|nr:nucleotidyltransferase domain-containing protein [bacterium]
MENSINEIPPDYKQDVEKAVKILKNVGCKEVYLFGSLAEGNIREESDIDIAVKGCPAGMFFHALGRLMLELEHLIDLIDLDSDDNFSRYLEQEGTLIHVA